MSNLEPQIVFLGAVNSALAKYRHGPVELRQVQSLFQRRPYLSPAMLASTIYLLSSLEKRIRRLEDLNPSIFADKKVMDNIYGQHISDDDSAELRKLVQMDLIRYIVISRDIDIFSHEVENETEKEEKTK